MTFSRHLQVKHLPRNKSRVKSNTKPEAFEKSF